MHVTPYDTRTRTADSEALEPCRIRSTQVVEVVNLIEVLEVFLPLG